MSKAKIMASGPITLWQIDRETMETVTGFIFLGSKITADGDCGPEIKRHLFRGWIAMTNLDNVLKSRDITLPTNVHTDKAIVFPVVMYRCENWAIKKDWVLKNWCLWTVVLEKTLKSPLDSKEIKPVNPKRNQPWIFIWRTDIEAEISILWPPDAKSWLIEKDPDAGKDWMQEKKGTAEDQVVGWHHQLNRHEFEQILGDGEGQGNLACNRPWDHKESDMTDQLNNNLHVCFPIWQ